MSLRANVLILLATCIISQLVAQEAMDKPMLTQAPRVMATAYFDWGFPVSYFGEHLHADQGIGFGGELLYKFNPDQPVWVGAGIHTFRFDHYTVGYTQEIDGEFFNFEERTATRMFLAHALIRFQPELQYFLRPYLQGGLGMHWIFTNTKIKDVDVDEFVDRINEQRDAILGFALNAGVHLVPRRFPDFRADLRFGYFRNASATYLRFVEGRGAPNGLPIAYFEEKESAIDLIALHFGFAVLIR